MINMRNMTENMMVMMEKMEQTMKMIMMMKMIFTKMEIMKVTTSSTKRARKMSFHKTKQKKCNTSSSNDQCNSNNTNSQTQKNYQGQHIRNTETQLPQMNTAIQRQAIMCNSAN